LAVFVDLDLLVVSDDMSVLVEDEPEAMPLVEPLLLPLEAVLLELGDEDDVVPVPVAPMEVEPLAPFVLFSADVLLVVLGVAPPLGEPLPPAVGSAAGLDAVCGELAEFCARAPPAMPNATRAAAVATVCLMFIPGLLAVSCGIASRLAQGHSQG